MCSRLNNSSPTPTKDAQNLRIGQPARQRGLRLQMELGLLIIWPWGGRLAWIIQVGLMWPKDYYTWKREAERTGEMAVGKRLGPMLLALKMEKWGHKPRKWPLEAGKGKEMVYSQVPRRNAARSTLDFVLRPTSNHGSPELSDGKSLFFSTTQLVLWWFVKATAGNWFNTVTDIKGKRRDSGNQNWGAGSR